MRKIIKKTVALVMLPVAICIDIGFVAKDSAKNLFKKKNKRVTLSSNENEKRNGK